jgi:hypothetical protein
MEMIGLFIILLFLFYPLFLDEFAMAGLAKIFKGEVVGDILTKRIEKKNKTILQILLFRFGGFCLNLISFAILYYLVTLIFFLQGKQLLFSSINDVIERAITVFDYTLLLSLMKLFDGFLTVFLAIQYFLLVFVFAIAIMRILMNFVNKIIKPLEKYQ